MKEVLVLGLSLSALFLPLAAIAQSLADVAREEEARRKTVKLPGRVYTNADLKPVASTVSGTGRTSWTSGLVIARER